MPPSLSGFTHSLREEVARFLTCYCKAPAQLDPENVSPFPSLTATLVEGIFLGDSLHFLEPAETLRARADPRPVGPGGDPLEEEEVPVACPS